MCFIILFGRLMYHQKKSTLANILESYPYVFQFSTGWLQCVLHFTSIPYFLYFCTFKTCSTQIKRILFVMYKSLNLLLLIFFNTKNNKSYVSVLCSWCVAGNRWKSFKEMEGWIQTETKHCLYFQMMICCCWWMWVL